jgi:hypothetical protein
MAASETWINHGLFVVLSDEIPGSLMNQVGHWPEEKLTYPGWPWPKHCRLFLLWWEELRESVGSFYWEGFLNQLLLALCVPKRWNTVERCDANTSMRELGICHCEACFAHSGQIFECLGWHG